MLFKTIVVVLLIVIVIQETIQMSTTPVSRDEFDAGLQALLEAEAARDAAVTRAIDDLIAKINTGQVPPTPADFTAELQIVKALQVKAATLTQTATGADPGTTDVIVSGPVDTPPVDTTTPDGNVENGPVTEV